jgi:predicted glycoside hydrolase/deacetylase ChbG (UPF0249 family)
MRPVPADERLLIVNADDFGLSDGVNRGIIQAHRYGIVTSTSLMVRAPAAQSAAQLARENPALGVGLHVDIGEWVLRDGEWITRYERVAEGDAPGAVTEVEDQVVLFEELVGRPPDHLDSHQHVHRSRPEVAQAVDSLAAELGIGVRDRDARVAYIGMYGQDGKGRTLLGSIQPAAYIHVIRNLVPGVTELGCHPGYVEDLDSDYRVEREFEVSTLCDPSVRDTVAAAGVRLVTWAGIR